MLRSLARALPGFMVKREMQACHPCLTASQTIFNALIREVQALRALESDIAPYELPNCEIPGSCLALV